MPNPLQRPAPDLAHPGRTLASALWSHAPGLLWRVLHPHAREAFVDGPPPERLSRLSFEASDGTRGCLWVVPPKPGAQGEPVLLLPTLGASPDVFRYGRDATLVDRLVDAGFAVYLVGHRLVQGVGEAASAGGFDDAATLNLPAAVDAARDHAGYPRVLVVGHGLGGQLGLAWAATHGGAGLGAMAVLSAPVRFPRTPSGLRRAALGAATRLPAGWRLPTQELARWSSSWTPVADPRVRGAMVHASEDVPIEVLQQVRAWFEAGALVDRKGALEYTAGLSRIAEPLWVGLGRGDRWCPPSWARGVRECWRAGGVTMHDAANHLDHLDLVLHPDAGPNVHAPLVAWLETQRVRAWREDVHPAGLSRVH